MAMLSKFTSCCRNCGKPIEVGQPISWARRGAMKGLRSWHVNCSDVWATGTTGTHNFQSTEQTAKNETTSQGEQKENFTTMTHNEQTANTNTVQSVATSTASGQITLDLGAMLAGTVKAEVSRQFNELDLASLASGTVRVVLETQSTDGEAMARDLGIQHKDFAKLLKWSTARDAKGYRLNIWLSGAAGTGKTTAAQRVAEALELPFYYTGSIDNQYALTGFIDAQGHIVSTEFRKAYSEGGIFLFDEVDGSSPNATLAFNAALANGHAVFPDGQLARHKDFLCIAAANTWGLGATNDYVGRNKLDAAFLDRFIFLFWGIDEALETSTCGNPTWSYRVQQVRRKVVEAGIKVLVTPRASYFGAALLAAGVTQDEVEAATLRKGMTNDQWDMVG